MSSSQSTSRRRAGVVAVALLAALPATASAARPVDAVVTVAGIRVETPAPGLGVALTALTIDGRGLDLVVETGLDGVTRVIDPATGAGGAAQVGVAAGKAACADGAYDKIGFRWTKPWAWRFRASSTPPGLGKAATERQLQSAVRAVTGARNDCGRPDRVSATATYLGRTAKKPGVRSDTGCGRPDGQNVIGFGSLPMFIAGLTCTWYKLAAHGLGRAIESDVLLRKAQGWALRPATCSVADNQVILRAVATHEVGHVFGLGHVRESTHPNLTMSETIYPCDDSAFTLGKGDILGLQQLY